MICFSNNGELPVECIETMGVSVKEGSAIGFFGTGLKYAISILVRNGISITIHSGTNRHTFSKATKTIRGKEFDILTMDGKPLAFTTEYGKTWDLWMAYRELYCNAIDEGGGVHAEAVEPKAGTTVIAVDGDAFDAVHHQRDTFFLIGRTPMEVVDDIEVYEGSSDFFFYRGVRVHRLNKPSLYTYNVTSRQDLNEDRTLKYAFYATYYMARAISRSKNTHFIRKAMTCGSDSEERSASYSGGQNSEEFESIALQEYKRNAVQVNDSVREIVLALKPTAVYGDEDAELSEIQAGMLTKSVEFLSIIGFNCSDYRIRIVETLGPSVMAMANREHSEIVLSKVCFDQGTKFLASTICEEIIHLREGLDDETRAMQTYLFNKIISLGEELAGEPI